MLRCSSRLVGIGLACALASSASAQLLTHKDLSAGLAVTIAQTAMATCTANGYRVSATVVGRNGEVLVQIRGDGTGPHTMENSFKKAFTARTFRIPSGEMEERLKQNPQMGAQYLTGFTTARGALPIKVGEDVIGAAGVSGAPGGEKDEACVKAGIDQVADHPKKTRHSSRRTIMAAARHPMPPDIAELSLDQIAERYIGRFRDKTP